jgi:hypothetical protein
MNKLAQEVLTNKQSRNRETLEKVALEQSAFTPWEH